MLNILQTGDLHLGKVLYEYSLIEDQKYVLDLLLKELHSFPYDALFITGDIYDRSIPSPEAICLFDNFLTTLNTDFPHMHIYIISGNHDSASRLSYASNFLKSKNIYITTAPEDCDKPFILHSKNGKAMAVYQIPFLHAGSLKSNKGLFLKSQEDLIQEAIRRILLSHKELEKTHKDSIPMLLSCHLFTLKGITSDSERLFLGNAELIDPKIFSPFLYTAIGHLHKTQKITNNAYYAGSPLSYSFSEVKTDKAFLRVEIDITKSNSITTTQIPIVPLRKLVQIEARFDDFEKMTGHKNDFIEFTCINDVPIENIASVLRKTFPFLLSVRQKAIISKYKNNEENISKQRTLFEKKEALPLRDILHTFLQSLGLESDDSTHSNNEWNDCINLFEKIATEVEREAHETK